LVALVVVAAIGGTVLFWRSSDGTSDLASEVAVQVDGTAVTVSAVAERIEVLKVLYGIQVPTGGDDLDTFRRRTAQALATSIVIEEAARSAGLAVTDETVSQALARYVAGRYGGTETEASDALAADLTDRGLEEQDLRYEFARQLSGQQLFDQVTAGIEIVPQAVREAYEEDPTSWAQPERRGISTIVTTDRASALTVLGRLRGGADFATAARRFSLDASTRETGGDLGVLGRADLEPRFARAAFSSRVGELFGPVQTPLGWYVGEVTSVEPARAGLNDLRQQIRQSLAVDRALSVWKAHVADLVDAAQIRYAAAYQPGPDDDVTPGLPGGPQ
jgi:peptidyl-prolyl cis-trans isomerase C